MEQSGVQEVSARNNIEDLERRLTRLESSWSILIFVTEKFVVALKDGKLVDTTLCCELNVFFKTKRLTWSDAVGVELLSKFLWHFFDHLIESYHSPVSLNCAVDLRNVACHLEKHRVIIKHDGSPDGS